VPYRLITTQSEEEFVTQATQILRGRIASAIAKTGMCILGLSGGSTPQTIYDALGEENIDWQKVWIFLVDERYVDPQNPQSNQRLIRETLLAHAPIPEEQMLFFDTTLPIEECMAQYTQGFKEMITEYLPHIVVLGMGEDGHIASLFPPLPEEALGDQRYVVHTQTDRFAVHDRVSLALNPLAAAQEVLMLLKGKGKKRIWEEMLASDEGEQRWPAKRVLENRATTVISLW